MADARIRVAACSIAPVKGLRLQRAQSVLVERGGLRGDRRFHVVDEHSRMVNGKQLGALQEVVAELDGERILTLEFPDGERVSAEVHTGAPFEAAFFSLRHSVVPLSGPFSAALSAHIGAPLRLVARANGTSSADRGARGAVTLVSEGSLEALAGVAGVQLDPRRFRMSIEVRGARAFEEDGWLGSEVRVGEAVIRPEGHVGRCLVTSRHPDSGRIDVPTLELLRELRGDAETTEPLALGVYASVLSPGAVTVGDAVEIGDTGAHADRAGRR